MDSLLMEKTDYLPILKVNRAEMLGIRELPNKDKDRITPVFSLKGWMSSNSIENTLKRIEDSFGRRAWVADIDSDFKKRSLGYGTSGEYPRQVFEEFCDLLNPAAGYQNWCEFIGEKDNVFPCLMLDDVNQIEGQINYFRLIERPFFVLFKLYELNTKALDNCLNILSLCDAGDATFILDFGDIDAGFKENINSYERIIRKVTSRFRKSVVAISATSFPFSFADQYNGEISIYERQFFQSIQKRIDHEAFVFSDHGSTRVRAIGGGGGTPPPRIDYPLKIEWKFIRDEFEDSKNVQEGEKERLYTEIANDLMGSDYWMPNLNVWGKQQIELTSIGDSYGISSAQDATAVRINLHLFQQLHFNDVIEEVDTDEDWVDE